jgi:glycosyltransferase involved in cell wall biosynthesis
MYLPSHGLDAVMGAAKNLQETIDIRFHFYGQGPEKERLEQFVNTYSLQNVIFHGFVSCDELLDGLAQSHICLGVFGETLQSHYTIQNKIWEGLAMERAVVSGTSDVINQVLRHKQNIFLIPRDNAIALTEAILELKNNPALRKQLATKGYQFYKANNSPTAIGKTLKETLEQLSSQ